MKNKTLHGEFKYKQQSSWLGRGQLKSESQKLKGRIVNYRAWLRRRNLQSDIQNLKADRNYLNNQSETELPRGQQKEA